MREWTGRHLVLVDTIAVAPFLLLYVSTLLGSLGGASDGEALGRASDPAHMTVAFALLLPLVVRRRFPVAVFTVVVAVAGVQLWLGVGLIAADVALLAVLYTVAAHSRATWSVPALVVVETGLLLALVLSPLAGWDDWDVFALYSFLFMLCWVTGLYVGLRRRYVLGLVERAQWLERERDARAQAAVAAERERIAREMHDVVAHNLGVMVVQAEGATYAVDRDPGRARGAMEAVASTGRSALSEIRGILGVLRDGGSGGEDGYAPRPGIGGLDQVVEQVRAAGLPVEFTVGGDRRRLPTGVELAAFRVVQEALTNALKHAGPGVGSVRVEVHYGGEALGVRVFDDGGGASSEQSEGEEGRGQGLIGMRERVSVHGGSLRAGPGPEGGFEVVASLPL